MTYQKNPSEVTNDLQIDKELSNLQTALLENAEFYYAAAVNSAHDGFADRLRARGQGRSQLADELAALVQPTAKPGAPISDSDPADDDGLAARLRRGLLTITAGMTIRPTEVDKRVLQETQDADDRLLAQYRTALDAEMDGALRARLQEQYDRIQADHGMTAMQMDERFDSVILALFANDGDIRAAAKSLAASGIDQEQIAVVGSQAVVDQLLGDRKAELTASASSVAAIGGSLLGGFLGFLAGIGTIMVPGVGAVLAVPAAATVLGSTAIGAGVGAAEASFLGMFVGLGVSEEETQTYTAGVHQGELLLMVHAAADDVASATETIASHNGTNVSVRTDRQLTQVA